jgi:tetratricopeptide (TPR) repeat protein
MPILMPWHLFTRPPKPGIQARKQQSPRPRLHWSLLLGSLCVAGMCLPGLSWANPHEAAQTANKSNLKNQKNAGSNRSAAKPIADPSRMDAQMFYQVLVGEIQLQAGEADVAYEFILDAARKTKDPGLFRRAATIALQARKGDRVLYAALLWRTAMPDSVEAHTYFVRMLSLADRSDEALEPLVQLLRLRPEKERPQILAQTYRMFAPPKARQTLEVMEKLAAEFRQTPALTAAGHASKGRVLLAMKEPAKALEMALLAQEVAPDMPFGIDLALEFWASEPRAKTLVEDWLKANPKNVAQRLRYARSLTENQHYAAAVEQLRQLTEVEPHRAAPWLTLGALQVQLRQPQEAERHLRQYLELALADPPVKTEGSADAPAQATPANDELPGDDADAPTSPEPPRESTQNIRQARLLLARVAEAQGKWQEAEQWLDAITENPPGLEVVQRRAALLARQNRLSEARELIKQHPAPTAEALRLRNQAELELLRDQKKWKEAYQLLEQMADDADPDPDHDLLYERAMMADRLKRYDDMERSLRKLIQLRPDYAQAYNALGYSLVERNTRLPEARQLIRKALDLSPGDPYITDSLGWLEYKMGQLQEALPLLQAAWKARPDTEIGAHLGEVLWKLDRKQEARDVWADALQRDADNEVLRETLQRLEPRLLPKRLPGLRQVK